MIPNTHLGIDTGLCGAPGELEVGRASVRLVTTEAMAVDDRGLVHGGFVFGAVDHAAMLAVNDPNVVLGSADVRFKAPVRVGEQVTCSARVTGEKGRKRLVEVEARVGDTVVLAGLLTCFVLEQHVLD